MVVFFRQSDVDSGNKTLKGHCKDSDKALPPSVLAYTLTKGSAESFCGSAPDRD